MNYSAIKPVDIANGIGVRVSLFVSGCPHHCNGCFNAETWDYAHGDPFTEETALRIFTLLKPDWVHGLSLLGGEPLAPRNIDTVASGSRNSTRTRPFGATPGTAGMRFGSIPSWSTSMFSWTVSSSKPSGTSVCSSGDLGTSGLSMCRNPWLPTPWCCGKLTRA